MSSRPAGMIVFALLAASCGEDPAALEILRNQQLEAPSCDPESSTRSLRAGTFDLALGDRPSYVMTALVRNRSGGEVSVSTVHIELEIEGPDGYIPLMVEGAPGDPVEAWDVDLCEAGACPFVAASEAATVEIPILPRVVTSYFYGMLDAAVREGRTPPTHQLRSHVHLIGRTTDDGELSSPELVYPVRVCLGCLVEYPEGSDSSSVPGVDCCGGAAGPESCLPGQDDPIDCRACRVSSPEICNFGRLDCRP